MVALFHCFPVESPQLLLMRLRWRLSPTTLATFDLSPTSRLRSVTALLERLRFPAMFKSGCFLCVLRGGLPGSLTAILDDLPTALNTLSSCTFVHSQLDMSVFR